MRSAFAEAAIRNGELPTWVLELKMPDGRRMLFSTAVIDLTYRSTWQSSPLQPIPLLTGVSSFEEELDVFSLDGVGALTQVKVSIAWHDSIAAMQGDWLHFSASTVEVSILWEGQDWEDRLTLLASGTVQGVQFGIEGETTDIMVESTPPRGSATVGDDARDLGADYPSPQDRLAVAMSELTGRKYQHVYGNPYSVPGYKVGDTLGTNVSCDLVLAGHHFADLSPVRVYEDGVWKGFFTPVNDTLYGENFCYVRDNTDFLSADGAYTYSADYGGIATADSPARAALGAGEILRKLLQQSGLKVDWGRMEHTLQKLASWNIGFYVDKEATAIDIIRDKLLKTVPIVEMNGGDGIWFAYVDPWSAPIEADLIMGQALLGRVGKMKLSDLESIENEATLSHTYEASSSWFTGTATRNADNSALCYFSQQLYGSRPADPVESKIIQDSATAEQALNHHMSRRALPRREVTYLVARDFYWIRAGMVVTITDPDLGITKVRAVAKSVARAQNPFYVSFDLIDRTPVSRLEA